MKSSNQTRVAVLGSLNVDLVASVPRLPGAGETVAATGLKKLFGGKGANQAVAAARAGARVGFIGCVGEDADGAAYRERLAGEGIDVAGVATAEGALTGTALIGVDAQAENLIMVAPEANGRVTRGQVRANRAVIEAAGALLMQFEVPLEAVVEAARIANRAGVVVLLNPSPYVSSFPWGDARVDCVIVNESEGAQLFGLKPATMRRGKGKWMRAMESRGIGAVVLTRGAASTLHLTVEGELTEVPTMQVTPVDTVGAGDAFAGAFAAFVARGETVPRSLLAGNCCGALATLKAGAQEAVPTRRSLLTAMRDAG